MRTQIERLSIGEAFDEAFDLYKRNFRLFVTTAAVLYVPASIILDSTVLVMGADKITPGAGSNAADVQRILGIFGVLMVAMIFYYGLIAALSGAITVMASERYLDRPISVGQAYRALITSLPRLLGGWTVVGILMAVGSFAVTFVLMLVVSALISVLGMSGAADPSLGTAIGMGIMVVLLVLFSALFVWLGIFLTPAVLLERAGAISSIQRNVDLVRGRAPRLIFSLIGLSVALLSIQYALTLTTHAALGWLIYPLLNVSELTQRIAQAVIGSLIGLLVAPLWMTFFTVLYYDQRVRREGFDLALMLVGLDMQRADQARQQEMAG